MRIDRLLRFGFKIAHSAGEFAHESGHQSGVRRLQVFGQSDAVGGLKIKSSQYSNLREIFSLKL